MAFKPFRSGPPSRHGRPPGRPASPDRRDDGLSVLYGHHTVVEALRNPARELSRLLVTENALLKLQETIGDLPIEPTLVRPFDIGRQLTADAVHQGVLLLAQPLIGPELDAMPIDGIVLALDQVTDPHNVGAILRTAAAFGVTAILTTERHSPEATGVLAKAASGALEHVPIVSVRNLGNAMETLGARGFLRVGLDSDAPIALDATPMRAPVLLALGAEGKGLRQRTRDICDSLARIDLTGSIRSLNVSNAAALSLYIVSRAIGRSA